MKLIIDEEWQLKMKRGEAQYCARCGNERKHARSYGITCVGRKRHIWKWSL